MIAVVVHMLLFWMSMYMSGITARNQMKAAVGALQRQEKPLEFTFVDIPEKEIAIKKISPDALPSDRDRISAAVAPEHYNANAPRLPEMHGSSKNLVIGGAEGKNEPMKNQPEMRGNEGKENMNKKGVEKVGEQNDVGEEATAKAQRGIDQRKFSESIKNMDRYIGHNEVPKIPTSSYEPEIPPDSSLWLDTQGVDLGPWARQVQIRVRKNWVVPMAAYLGFKGKVAIDFEVLRNGTVQNLIIRGPSGIISFDQAALNALAISNPLPPLPTIYPRPVLKGRFTFYYNMDADDK
jgi:TonB family protein